MTVFNTNYQNTVKTQVIKSAILLVALFATFSNIVLAQELETVILQSPTGVVESTAIEPVSMQPDPSLVEITTDENVPQEEIITEEAVAPIESMPLTKEQEKQLNALEKQLEKGEITQEEYDFQRQAIVGTEASALRVGEPISPESQTAGKYVPPSVSAKDGSLTYQYKIVVPPGRDGLQPNLNLVYDSANRSRSSLVSQGWSFDIPFIQRLNKKGVDKLYTENYFMSSLDGELVSQGGGVYKPMVENGAFLKYQLAGDIWTVTAKDGTQYVFGQTAQSRQANPSDATKIFAWMLEKVTDTNGNTVTYTYFKDQGQIYPENIQYNQENNLSIAFNRTASTFALDSYNAGFKIRTSYLIDRIDVNTLGQVSSRYNLSFTSNQLSSVSLIGYDDINQATQPLTTTLEYTSYTGDGWETTPSVSADNLALNSYEQYHTLNTRQLADVNGDGLADNVWALKRASNNSIYTGTSIGTGTGFTSSAAYTIPTSIGGWFGSDGTGSSYTPNLQLTDVNGDGLLDLAKQVYEGAFNGVRFYLNTGDGWETTPSVSADNLALNSYEQYHTLNTRQLADVNGDGLADNVWALKRASNNSIYTGTSIGTGTGFTSSAAYTIPTSIGGWFGSDGTGSSYTPNLQLTDVNGDGLLDLAKQVYEGAFNGVRFYLNTGDGWETTPSVSADNLALNSYEQYHTLNTRQLADVNGDGLADNVWALKRASNNSIYTGTSIGTGTGFTSSAAYTIPTSIGGWFGSDGTGSSYTPNLQLTDVNGDGLLDLAKQVYEGAFNGVRFYLNTGKTQKLLSKVTDATGGQSNIKYSTAQVLDSSNDVPFAVPVVQSVTSDDKNGNIATTTYQYKDADFYFKNNLERKFAGFGEITKTNPDGSKVATKYHQANGQTGNEPTDSYAKIGKLYEEVTTDSSGSAWLKKRFTYIDTNIGTSATSSLLTSELTQRYDGTTSHTDTAITYAYDAYGNITTETKFGVVTGNADGTFTDTASDKRTIESSYVANTTDYIVGLLKSRALKNNVATQEGRTNYHYDVDGNLLEEGRWISGTDYATTTYTYNNLGLITSEKDALNNTTTYTYDTNNLYPATITKPLSQATIYTYDYSSGKPKTITDPNGKIIEYTYDGLDRLLTEKRTVGNGGTELVRTRAYNTTASPQYITDTLYRSGSDTSETRSYLDGFGREIQKKAQYSGGWATVDTTYDDMGRVLTTSIPYHSNTSNDTSRTQISYRLTENTYDPLGRVTVVENVRGATTMTYDGFSTDVTDAEGNNKKYTTDAYDNLTEVKEYNGTSTYTTTYGYNTNNFLVAVTDAEGNIRSITYDGLGRRTQLQDLHASTDNTYGVWNFTYDDVNLLVSTDPNGDVTTYTYDDLNRVLTEDSNSTAHTDITYTYDSCTNGIGSVCHVATDVATASYTYYKQGTDNTKSVNLDGTSYTTNTTYNRQNQPTAVTYPNSDVTTFTYGIEGLPVSVARNGLVYATSTYGVHGKVLSTKYANGYTTDYTYDKEDIYSLTNKVTGIADSLIPVVTYSTTTIPAHTDIKFFDDFEGDPAVSWTESNEYDWQTEPEAIANVPGSSVTNKVMHADACTSYCVISTTNSINISGASSAEMTLWRFVGSALDSGEYLKVQVYNGSQWIEIATWAHPYTDDNTWHSETLDLTSYINSNLKVRFLAKMSSNGEYVEVDDVQINATYPQQVNVSSSTTYINGYAQKIQDLTYTYDNVGNILSITDTSVTDTKKSQSFTYDDLYRLTGVTTTNVASGTSAYTQSFAFSPVGNITNFNGTALTYAGTSYANPHAATSVGGATHTYDNNGNLTNDSIWTHVWDYRNRLTSSTNGANTATYQYNYENARTKLTEAGETTYYPFPDYEITSGTPKLYLNLGETPIATIEGSTTTYLHTDHLGGTTLTTNSSGAITQTLDYYPYGDTRLDTGTNDEDTQFTGYKKDDFTGLNYAGARYYAGNYGRFISQDPVYIGIGVDERTLQALRDPQMMNSYSYARNNPLVYKDPDGEWAHIAIGAGAGILGQYGYDVYNNIQSDGFSASDFTSNLSSPQTYATRAMQGGAVALTGGLAATAGLGVAGQSAAIGVSSAATSYVGNSYLGEPVTASGLIIEGTVSGLTFGAVSSVPKVPGRLPNFGTNAFYTGKHTQQSALSLGIDSTANYTSSVLSQLVTSLTSLRNSLKEKQESQKKDDKKK